MTIKGKTFSEPAAQRRIQHALNLFTGSVAETPYIRPHH